MFWQRKQHTKIRAALGWLAILLQLIVSVEVSFGLNLCVAEDGHTTLEFGHSELPCVQDSLRHHPDDEAIDAHELTRHPCQDLPLLGALTYVKRDTQSDRHLPVLSALSAPVQTSAPTLSRLALPPKAVEASFFREQTAHFLRTVILLV